MPRSTTFSSRSPDGNSVIREHPMYQLALSRMREFYREPEAVFWVFGFPIVLAFALGLAFRNTGPGRLQVGVTRGPGDSALVATPMRKSHYLLSFILSRLVFLIVEVVALVGFGWLLFGVAVRGSFVSLAGITVLGSFAFAGLGLLVASRAKTIEGVSGLMNLVMLPMWILSGTFFSYARFPDAMIPFVKALPLTALNDALRAVMIDGTALTTLGTPIAIVVAWGAVSFVVALKIFRWR